MASVTLTQLWLHTATDNSDSLTLGQNAEVENYSQPVEVRRYSGGRLRAVRRSGTAQRLEVAVPFMSRADYRDLQGRVGVTQLLRDQRGRRLWGVIGEVDGDEDAANDAIAQATFVFHQITYDEEA